MELKDVPHECEIIELLYRLSRPAPTHIDVLVAAHGVERRLRFAGPRVVQFQPEMPEVLFGLDVQDLGEERIGELGLWVSVGGGAVTFWAKAVSELDVRSHDRAEPRDDPAPLVAADEVRAWDPFGVPRASFRYRSPLPGGPLRGFTISTHPFGRT